MQFLSFLRGAQSACVPSHPASHSTALPRRVRRGGALVVALALVFGAGHADAQTAGPGMKLSLAPSFGGSLRMLSNGEWLRWSGASLDRLDANGAVVQNYATFSPSVFTGALALAPDESFAIVGESSNGAMYRLDLPNGPLVPLANLPFNFDAAISAQGDVIVSATAFTFFFNELVELDPSTGQLTFLGTIPGPSGPVAFDPAGNLYYATQVNTFPAPLGFTDVLLWLAPTVQAGTLSVGNAIFFETGLDGGSSLAVDPTTNRLYLAESNFSFGYVSKIREVTQFGLPNPVLFEGPPGAFVGFSQLIAGTGPGVFAPFQPDASARLRIAWNDFAGNSGARFLGPKRPTAQFSGPGTSGVGPASFEVAGGPPGGFGFVLIGPTTLVGTTEIAVLNPVGLPLLTPLNPGTIVLLPGATALDSAGAFNLGFFNPGTLNGLVSAQALFFDGGLYAVGTSTLANL